MTVLCKRHQQDEYTGIFIGACHLALRGMSAIADAHMHLQEVWSIEISKPARAPPVAHHTLARPCVRLGDSQTCMQGLAFTGIPL